MQKSPDDTESFVPTEEESEAISDTMSDYIKGRSVLNKSYNQLNHRTIFDAIDDWTKRWNGYIPSSNPLLDDNQSRIFLNFTRNAIISYISKIAMTPPEAKVKAVNKGNGLVNQQLAKVYEDLLEYSSDEENGPARFFESALEITTKGTVIKYEGYAKNYQKMKVPEKFDAETGEIEYKEENRVLFDNCFQEIVPVEDFYIPNPYQPDVQKQPFVIWKKITTYDECAKEYSHYKNWEFVKKGEYTITAEPTTFYRNQLQTELQPNQVEMLRYYNRMENIHRIIVNGVLLYNGPIPFKDGKYPFAKGVFEPFANDFFWGAGYPQKIMGEQDGQNTLFNMMVDKTYGSLTPFGLSSDLDDLVEDDFIEVNKIRKVGDITKWRFESLPGVSAGESNMLQTMLSFARENSGTEGGAGATTPRGGKMQVRQVLLKQQEALQKLGFSLAFMEDFERDRTELRLSHILQFYSIPKMEKVTGKAGKEIEQLNYRDIKRQGVELSNGKAGSRVVKLFGGKSAEDKKKMSEDFSILEAMGELQGTPTEVIGVDVDTFYDHNFAVTIVKNSTYQKNQVLDQASRQEYANWRLSLAQVAPLNVPELIKWVNEAYDIPSDRFEMPNKGVPGAAPGSAPATGGAPGAVAGNQGPAEQMAPSNLPSMSSAVM